MKVFVLEYVGQVSDNYHSNGGLVVFAENLRAAKMQAAALSGCEVKAEEWADAKVFKLAQNYKPQVFVFPDAGCC